MPYKEACYLYNAILKQDEEAGFGRDSLWNPVWEAMSIFKLRYEFVVSLCQADLGLLKFVNFEKVKKRKEVSTIENIKAIIENAPSTIDKEFEETKSISKGVENLNISGKNDLKITVSNDYCNTNNNESVQYISDKDSEPLPENTESTEVNIHYIVNENNNEISYTDNEVRSEDCIESHVNEVLVNKELANVKTVDSYKNVQEHNEGDLTGNINSVITTQSEEPLSNVLQNERITADDEKVKGFKVISYNNVKDSNEVEAENIDSVSMQVDVPTLSTGLNEEIAVEEKNNEFEVNACNHIERGNHEDLTKNKDSDSRHVDVPALCSALQTDGIIVDDEKIISCNNIKGVNAEDLIENKDSDTAHFKVPILSNELQNEGLTAKEGKIKKIDPIDTNNKDNIITFNTQNVETIKEANGSTETYIGNKVTTVQVTMEVDNNINEPEDILNIIITESVIMKNDVTDVQPSMEICIDGNQLENSDNIDITNINNTREMLNEEIKIKSTMEIDTNMSQIENRLSMRDDVSITQPSIEIGADGNQIDYTEVTNKSNTQEIANEEIKLNPNMEINTNMNQLEYTFNITDTDMRNDVTMVQPITEIGIDENQLNNSNTTNVINISNTKEITNEKVKIKSYLKIDTNVNQVENLFNITDTDMRNDVITVHPSMETSIDGNELDNSNIIDVKNINNTNGMNEEINQKSSIEADTNINLPEIGENELNNSNITDVRINITNEISNDEIKSTINTNINLEENSTDTTKSSNKYILTPEELELKESTKRTPTSPKSLRRLDLKRKLVHSVSNTFLMNNLETILEFVKDDSRASLEISELSTSEMYVLLRLNTLNPLTASADVFNDDCMNLIVRLFNILNKKTGFKLCSYAPKANKREKKKRYQIVVENLDNVNYKG
ncbi:uncharacterized protein [Epargyreus clarus]|uniref:uncharacterized protein n=1 Tax=Epargyreus clarus TaxID=520877 RepID=UPI003C2EF4F5